MLQRSVEEYFLCLLCLQSTAKQQYLLSDNDLRNAPCLRRANPHRKDWQPMKLYLESHVQEIAFEKYGGQEGLEKEARGRVCRKLEARLKVGRLPWCRSCVVVFIPECLNQVFACVLYQNCRRRKQRYMKRQGGLRD